MSTRARSLFLALLALSGLSLCSAAATINVPADQPTIQAGITAASNGDTVLVAAGTYYESIDFLGKAITLTSVSGPAATIIDGSNDHGNATVTFDSNETPGSVISGFTIQNSNSGIVISTSSPTITGNILTLNCTSISIYDDGSPSITANLIAGNIATSCYNSLTISAAEDSAVQFVGNIVSANNGAGVSVYQAANQINVSQNLISHNQGFGLFVYGGEGPITVIQNVITGNAGIGLSWSSPPITAVGNTIANNNPGCCGASSSEVSASDVGRAAVLENNIIVATGSLPAFFCDYSKSAPTLKNNDVFSANSPTYSGECPDVTGTLGNISADPLFVDSLADNLHIQPSSPAIKAGAVSAKDEPATDMDGDARIIAHAIDIGADEYTANPTLSLSSAALHYATQQVGTAGAPQVVTLTNNGTKAIALNLIATSANYSQANNCASSLAAGASCQISVTFSPIANGLIDGVLGIFTNATANPFAVNLVGTGLAPQIQVNPSQFSFYDQVINTSRTQKAIIENVGQVPLTISGIAYSGPGDFVASNNCPVAPATLAVHKSCNLSVTYTPTVVGPETGTLTINSNAIPNSLALPIFGDSVSAGVAKVNPASLTFPTTLIGQSSSPQTASLTNAGKGPLGIESISSYGDFSETNNCPASLAVRASCTISITYTPSEPGDQGAGVDIQTDALAFNTSISVSGTGVAGVPTITSLSLTSIPVGSGDTQITVTGTGFVYGSELLWNGVPLSCCSYTYGSTQLNATIPAANLITAGTFQLSVFTPAPGGGTSNSVPFTVYTPINYAYETTTYKYRTIAGKNLGLNYYNSAQVISPFPIQFGGGSYNTLTVGSGGTISFDGFANGYNTTLPTTEAYSVIAPFWEYLYAFGSGNDNNVFWEVNGAAPNRELVIEWRDVALCCETTNTIKFEVVFFEGSGNILFNYADTVFGGQYSQADNGADATVGVQVTPVLATQYSYNQPLLKSQTAVLWYPSSPIAALSSSTLGFGYHQIGTTSIPQKLTLTNGGVAPLQISGIAIDNPDFTQTNTCGATLASHKSCVIHVTFIPSVPSAETATLTVTDNASNSPQTASLTGIGTITPIVVYPIMANFGSVNVGTTASLPVVLANASDASLSIQQITAAPAVFSETNNCGSTLAPGTACTVTVTFAPSQAGNITGTLSMGLNGNPAVTEVKLMGSGH